VGGQLDEPGPERHDQPAARVVEADAVRPAGQIEPPPRLDARAHGEDEQRVAARVGHPAPGRRRAAVQAREVRGADAGGRATEHPPAPVAQLEHALAAEEHDAAPVRERRDLASRTDRRGKLLRRSRAAGDEHCRRGTEEERRADRTRAEHPHADRTPASHASAAHRTPRA
jgi:hypothetical protein